MKAVISSTYDDKYLYFIPIVTWCWNKLGVDVICFMPRTENISLQMMLINKVQVEQGLRQKHYFFNAPEHKEATYAQVSRLYGACLDLPEDEVLVTADADMAFFSKDCVSRWNNLYHPIIFGADLVPDGQYPMCYAAMTVKQWRMVTKSEGKTYQQCLDEELGGLDSLHFRGNFWSKDQETLHNLIHSNDEVDYRLHNRAKPGTQFATQRLDRDDSFILERLSPDIWDYHCNRPGYEPQNFEKIMAILSYYFPHEDLSWINEYNEKFKQLL